MAEKVAMANEILASWGTVAIDTDQKGYTGYGFQYTIDAVNAAFDPDGWRYELLTHQVEKSSEKAHKAFVLLQLHLRLANGSWFTKGPQFGGSQNVDPTDALKGALSDGLKKRPSAIGVSATSPIGAN